jgi:4-diphosphocytidyl-2-C-methyl-D-erythritol kinase
MVTLKMSRRPLAVRAFAKINLTLSVLGLREDGYHELRTVFQSLALHDTLTFSRAAGPFTISCNEPSCPVDRTNLIWRAAEQVWAAARRRGLPRGVAVRLQKRIPAQAGLGGGSSDAAAAIRGLAAFWGVRLTRDRLQAIAAGLGADVPFFLDGGTSLGVERGDVLFPLTDVRSAWVVLAVPGFGVSTADAYRWWDEERERTRASAGARVACVAPEFKLHNDLEGPVTRHHREIVRLVKALHHAGAARAAMSGSGSVVFGLFRTRESAAAAARRVARPGRRVLVTRTLSRPRFLALAAPRSP